VGYDTVVLQVDTNVLKVFDFCFIKVEVSRVRCGQVL
jgi:hypothetical protein